MYMPMRASLQARNRHTHHFLKCPEVPFYVSETRAPGIEDLSAANFKCC